MNVMRDGDLIRKKGINMAKIINKSSMAFIEHMFD